MFTFFILKKSKQPEADRQYRNKYKEYLKTKLDEIANKIIIKL